MTAASGVHNPTQINIAVTAGKQRVNKLSASENPVAVWATPVNERATANRSIKSPRPGHELGNVENSLCTPKYEAGVRLRDNPQKSEARLTLASYGNRIPRFRPRDTAWVRSLAPSFARTFLM